MELLLGNDDVRSIWSKPLTVAVKSVDQAVRDYRRVTLTDGTVHATALLQGDVPTGRQLALAKHRVQWINGTRYWFVTAWTDAGPAPPPNPTRLLGAEAPPPAPVAEHPFVMRNVAARKRAGPTRPAPPAKRACEHPFVL